MRKIFFFFESENDLMKIYMQISNPRRLYHGISHSVINPACEIAHTRLCEIRDLSGTIDDFYSPISVEPRGHGFSSHGGNR